MSDDQRRLLLAAKLIRRLDGVGGMQTFEGESLLDLAWACSQAANESKIAEVREQIFRCNVDELAEVVDLHDFSKKVGA